MSPRPLLKHKYKYIQPEVQEGVCFPCAKNNMENAIMHLRREFHDLSTFTHEETGMNLNQLYRDRVRRGLGHSSRPDLDNAIDALEQPLMRFRDEAKVEIEAARNALARDWGDDIEWGPDYNDILNFRGTAEVDPDKRLGSTKRQGKPYPLPTIQI